MGFRDPLALLGTLQPRAIGSLIFVKMTFYDTIDVKWLRQARAYAKCTHACSVVLTLYYFIPIVTYVLPACTSGSIMGYQDSFPM